MSNEVENNNIEKNRRELKEEKRLRKQNRRKHPEVSKEIIKYWNELRDRSVNTEQKVFLCDKIIKASKTSANILIQQSSTSRVFESLIRYGNEEQKWSLFELIKNDILDLCLGKYSAFSVVSMLKHGLKEQKLQVYNIVKENIIKLTTRYSVKIAEYTYKDFATSFQRNEMLNNLYGKTFKLFYNKGTFKTLDEVVGSTLYYKTIVKEIDDVVMVVLKKGLIVNTLYQDLIFNYFKLLKNLIKHENLDDLPYVEEKLEKLFSKMKDLSIYDFCNTNKGSKLATIIFWNSNAKERKTILNDGKELVIEMATSQYAYILFIAMLDQNDDTVMVNKCLLKTFISQLDNLITNKYARKVLEFILNYRDPKCFNTVKLDFLKQGDGNAASKKDMNKRAEEILNYVKGAILEWLTKHIETCLNYCSTVTIVTSIMNKCLPENEEMTSNYNSILKAIAQQSNEAMVPTIPTKKRKAEKSLSKQNTKKQKFVKVEVDNDMEVDEEVAEEEKESKMEEHLLESPAGQILTRVLFNLEKEGKIDFSSIVMTNIEAENILTFIGCNRTAFFLVNLYETGSNEVKTKLSSILLSQSETIVKSELPGVKILRKHLIN